MQQTQLKQWGGCVWDGTPGMGWWSLNAERSRATEFPIPVRPLCTHTGGWLLLPSVPPAQGETVQALALDGNNTRIATGDSGGIIKVGKEGGAGAAAALPVRTAPQNSALPCATS